MRTFVLALLLTAALAFPKDDSQHSGEVRYYSPGERISITIRPQVEAAYDLAEKDTVYRINPQIRVGSHVDIEETKTDDGRKLIIIHAHPQK